tara:strand:+ start:3913 stop:4812 length:900 start_codon:yes stop_codon:yes gene_type:complete
MNKHLLFILVFIIIIPIILMNGIGYTLIQCASDCFQGALLNTGENPDLSRFYYLAMMKALSIYFLCVGGYFLIAHLRLVGSTKQKVSFINQVSHELKTPLTNLRLYIDLLKNELADDSNALKKIGILEQESTRLDRLVRNILLFSYGQRLTLNRQDEDIDALITRVAQSFRPLFDQQAIEIQLDCQAGHASVDRGVLEQVLVNLIGNVEKYASDGDFINITARKKEGQVSITVQDDGPGIPDHMKAHVFQPFVRGDDRLTEGVSGIGIGLTLCVNLMEAHNGVLRLKESDHGTCFEVIF